MRRLDLSLYAITDERYWNERKMSDLVEAALKGGITALQLRNKEADTSKLIEDGLELRTMTKQYNVSLIINDRIDVALEVDADGVHLGQQDASPEEARSILGMSKIIGISVHDLDQASEALELPVDYLGVGSVYSSETEEREVIGIDRFEKICRTVSLPVAGIGGITVDRVEEVIKAGASGVAAISGIWNVEDVEGRVREYVSKLEAIKRSR
jgi:thiamine-phosphate pyrophosphorylase